MDFAYFTYKLYKTQHYNNGNINNIYKVICFDKSVICQSKNKIQPLLFQLKRQSYNDTKNYQKSNVKKPTTKRDKNSTAS